MSAMLIVFYHELAPALSLLAAWALIIVPWALVVALLVPAIRDGD